MPRATDARQRMIVSAALLQRERGVPGTGLPEVLKHSGAPRGSVYHHFPGGRDQVATEATTWAAGLIGDALDRLLEERPILEALDAFAERWAAVLRDEDFAAGCPVAAGALDFTEGSGAREAAAAGFSRWTASIAAALRREGVPAARAEELAITAIAVIEGAITVSRAQRSLAAYEAVTAHLRGAIAAALDA